MKHLRLLAISRLFLGVSAGRAAADTEVDPGTAFSRLKALVGDWDVASTNSKGHSKFELIAESVPLGEDELAKAYGDRGTSGLTLLSKENHRWTAKR